MLKKEELKDLLQWLVIMIIVLLAGSIMGYNAHEDLYGERRVETIKEIQYQTITYDELVDRYVKIVYEKGSEDIFSAMYEGSHVDEDNGYEYCEYSIYKNGEFVAWGSVQTKYALRVVSNDINEQ